MHICNYDNWLLWFNLAFSTLYSPSSFPLSNVCRCPSTLFKVFSTSSRNESRFWESLQSLWYRCWIKRSRYSLSKNSTVWADALEASFAVVLEFDFVLFAEKLRNLTRLANLRGGLVFLWCCFVILNNNILVLLSFHVHDVYGLLKLFA